MNSVTSAASPDVPGPEHEGLREVENAFKSRLMETIRASVRECRYTPHAFMDMIAKHGAIEAARMLMHTRAISDGFVRLWEKGRLDLTVERIIVHEREWAVLFTAQERRIAEQRLNEWEKNPSPWIASG